MPSPPPLPMQNDDPHPPVLRRHSSSDISKQRFGTMPLVPIRGDESNSTMLSANQTLVRNYWYYYMVEVPFINVYIYLQEVHL